MSSITDIIMAENKVDKESRMNKNKETIETDDLKMRLGLSQSKNIQLIVEKKNTTCI